MRVLIAAIVVLMSTSVLAQKFKQQNPDATIKLQEKPTFETLKMAKSKQVQIDIKNPAYKKVVFSTLPQKNDKVDTLSFLVGAAERRQSFLSRSQKTLIKKIIADAKAHRLQDAEKKWEAYLVSIRHQKRPVNLNNLLAHIVVNAFLSHEAGNLKIVRENLAKAGGADNLSSLKSLSESVARVHSLVSGLLTSLHGAAEEAVNNIK